jgi:hypothetical protein
MMRPHVKTKTVRLPRRSSACAVFLAVGLFGFGFGLPARADFTTYFGMDAGTSSSPPTPLDKSQKMEQAFVAALSGVRVENFDSLATGSPPPTPFVFTPLPGMTGANVSATATVNQNDVVTSSDTNGTFPISGTQFVYASGGANNGLSVTLDFSSSPIAGFGMYITDLSDSGSTLDQIQYTMKLTDGTTVTKDTSKYVTSELTNSHVIFFGEISNDPSQLISSITIITPDPTANGDDAIGVDDMTIGASAVPEPASVVMLTIGAGVVLAGRRFSRRRGRNVVS